MKHWKLWLVLGIFGFLGVYIGDWYVERWFHYKWSYESLVKNEVRSMVKRECLLE